MLNRGGCVVGWVEFWGVVVGVVFVDRRVRVCFRDYLGVLEQVVAWCGL